MSRLPQTLLLRPRVEQGLERRCEPNERAQSSESATVDEPSRTVLQNQLTAGSSGNFDHWDHVSVGADLECLLADTCLIAAEIRARKCNVRRRATVGNGNFGDGALTRVFNDADRGRAERFPVPRIADYVCGSNGRECLATSMIDAAFI